MADLLDCSPPFIIVEIAFETLPSWAKIARFLSFPFVFLPLSPSHRFTGYVAPLPRTGLI